MVYKPLITCSKRNNVKNKMISYSSFIELAYDLGIKLVHKEVIIASRIGNIRSTDNLSLQTKISVVSLFSILFKGNTITYLRSAFDSLTFCTIALFVFIACTIHYFEISGIAFISLCIVQAQ